jgi:MarR family transcriptional regulator, negative regulator of the multidrug operon emrRAB
MKNDYLKDLGYLGVTARIKRLSDALSSGIKDLYLTNNVDIEPSWHLLFLYLKKEKQSTLSEIAEVFRFSQPAAYKMITRMVKKGYILVEVDNSDGRKKILRLSAKAKKNMPKYEKIWDAGLNSVREMLKANKDFLSSLENFELQHESKSFTERAKAKIKK